MMTDAEKAIIKLIATNGGTALGADLERAVEDKIDREVALQNLDRFIYRDGSRWGMRDAGWPLAQRLRNEGW